MSRWSGWRIKLWSSWLKQIGAGFMFFRASLVAQKVNNLPVMQETWVGSLGQEDSLEKLMATHSSILAWTILWLQFTGS